MGDTNGRTSDLADFIENDSDQYIPLPHDYELDMLMKKRHNVDKIANSHGQNLINLCIASRMPILNGRTPGDFVGRLTCYNQQGASSVYYILCLDSFIQNIVCTNVKNLTQHSKHCPVGIVVKCDFQITEYASIPTYSLPKKIKLTQENKDIYQSFLSSRDSQNEISLLIRRNDALTQQNIISIVDSFENIVIKAAEDTCSATHTSRPRLDNRKCKHTRPLGTNDNKDVHKLRKQFRKLAYLVSKYPNNSYIRGRIQIARKKLCKASKQQDHETKNKLFEKLENLHNEDPTTYWNIISDLTDKNTTKNTIPDSMIEKLKSHFENLGRPHPDTMHENLQSERERLENEISSNEMLDSLITENEIKHAIKSLKSNKACGPERITNEMLKFGVHSLLTPLCKVFNSVFTSGLYPSKWSTSYISTIHKNGPKTDPSNYRSISITSCVSKIYSSILNSRLTLFLDNNNIINNNQSGFERNEEQLTTYLFLKPL